MTGQDVTQVLTRRRPGAPAPVEAFKRHGADFVVERELPALVRGMNALTDEPLIDPAELERQIVARDREIGNPYTQGPPDHRDPRRPALPRRPRHPHRRPAPHPGPGRGPLIAVLHILTRKTLGGLRPT